jgi:hypothetical protein
MRLMRPAAPALSAAATIAVSAQIPLRRLRSAALEGR